MIKGTLFVRFLFFMIEEDRKGAGGNAMKKKSEYRSVYRCLEDFWYQYFLSFWLGADLIRRQQTVLLQTIHPQQGTQSG